MPKPPGSAQHAVPRPPRRPLISPLPAALRPPPPPSLPPPPPSPFTMGSVSKPLLDPANLHGRYRSCSCLAKSHMGRATKPVCVGRGGQKQFVYPRDPHPTPKAAAVSCVCQTHPVVHQTQPAHKPPNRHQGPFHLYWPPVAVDCPEDPISSRSLPQVQQRPLLKPASARPCAAPAAAANPRSPSSATLSARLSQRLARPPPTPAPAAASQCAPPCQQLPLLAACGGPAAAEAEDVLGAVAQPMAVATTFDHTLCTPCPASLRGRGLPRTPAARPSAPAGPSLPPSATPPAAPSPEKGRGQRGVTPWP
jgi:hypothetical protein